LNRLARNFALLFTAAVVFTAMLNPFVLFAWEAGLFVGLVFVGFPFAVYLIMRSAFGSKPSEGKSGWAIGMRRAALYFVLIAAFLVVRYLLFGPLF
jgi:hypothetical protein